jgi:altronate hydrolase
MINGFKDYYARHGEPVDENPSPGNRAGGITTLEEKSLGCVLKGGTSPVAAVLDYGDTLKDSGLHLLAGPGNDMVAVTALAAAGAQATLFTTGRGTPLGGPVPTIKISSTSALCAAKGRWIDFDAGPLLSGAPLSSLAERLFEHLLDVASGRARTRSEAQGCRAIAIWKDGVTL